MSWSQNGTPTGAASNDADTFDGSDAVADSADGLGGNDVLAGLGDNDTLEGGAGYDGLYGGTEDDLLTDAADGGNLNGEDGDDTIAIALDGMLDEFSAFAFGGAGADLISVTGAGLQDSLGAFIGISALGEDGNDTITTGASDDFIGGGGDDDSIDAGDGNDAAYGDAGNDTVIGGAGADLLLGENGFANGTGDDLLLGGDGDDALYGENGADSLDGGTGTDALYGGDGDDTLDAGIPAVSTDVQVVDGGAGFDRAVYRDSGAVLVQLADGTGTKDGAEGTDNLVDIEAVEGGAGADTMSATGTLGVLFEGAGNDDLLTGGEGDDTLLGGADADTLAGGDGNDTLAGGDGVDSLDGGTGTNALDFSDAVEGVEMVMGQGDIFNDGFGNAETIDGATFTVAYGSAQGDGFFAGSGAADSLFGQAGDDRLFGGGDNDTLLGGTEDDRVAGEEGDDLALGGEGNDTLVGGRVDLNTGELEPAGDPTGGDTLLGEAGDDSLVGVGGEDWLEGGADSDTLQGGEGNDTLLGGEGDDRVLGGEGADSIVATPGRDTVAGEAGDDVIVTGDDEDLVIWNAGDGNDTVDLGAGADTLRLQGWDEGDWDTAAGAAPGEVIFTYRPSGEEITATGFESVTCFAEGTRILTPRGEVPVETLRAGDLVAAPGAGAPLKPVRWVGRMRVDVARGRDRAAVAPVLIRAGALGPGMPARDLRLSPEHALLLQGRLVPARLLLNGTTIVQELWARAVTYWHVELDAHGVLVAEGALAESYLDDGNRHLFDRKVAALDPDFGAGRQGGRYAALACAPPVLAADDPALAAIRAALPAPARAARSA
jgi:Ca2+-binding RTX toxin-like protein